MTDLTVPGISELDPVGNRPSAPVPKAFPGHVQQDIKQPNSWQQVKDYQPSAGKKAQILEAKGLKPKSRGIGPMPVRKLHGVDHMTYEEAQKTVKKKGSLIKKMATEMLQDREQELRRYKIAKQIISKATASQRKNPTPKIQKALSILEKGPPITHEEALQEARDRVFRENM